MASDYETLESAKRRSYQEILRSSVLIGGSQVANIAIGIIRTKAMALMLGPSGIGLAGLYGSVVDVAAGISGLGVNSSGVRQIAVAVGSGDTRTIALTVGVLRRTSVVLGVIGLLLLVAFSDHISTFTFGENTHRLAVALLGCAVFCRLVSAGQAALLQGMRHLSDLSRMTVIGALLGTVMGLPLVYVLGSDGVVFAILAVSAGTLAVSFAYSRRIPVEESRVNTTEYLTEAASLIQLGLAFMTSTLVTMGSAYAIRVIILHKAGFAYIGLYQAAWTLGGLYVGIVLQAMGADFYPRLTSVISDDSAGNRLVNEQARMSLILAGPGVLATLTFAPLVISIFYASSFVAAVDLLRWICLGIALRVISWPMGFIIMAKAHRKMLVFSELSWAVVHLAMAVLLIDVWGLTGVGIAFLASYVFHAGLVYTFARQLTSFRWTLANRNEITSYLVLIAIVFVATQVLPSKVSVIVGVCAIAISCWRSACVLLSLLPLHKLPRRLVKLADLFRLTPEATTLGHQS